MRSPSRTAARTRSSSADRRRPIFRAATSAASAAKACAKRLPPSSRAISAVSTTSATPASAGNRRIAASDCPRTESHHPSDQRDQRRLVHVSPVQMPAARKIVQLVDESSRSADPRTSAPQVYSAWPSASTDSGQRGSTSIAGFQQRQDFLLGHRPVHHAIVL